MKSNKQGEHAYIMEHPELTYYNMYLLMIIYYFSLSVSSDLEVLDVNSMELIVDVGNFTCFFVAPSYNSKPTPANTKAIDAH